MDMSNEDLERAAREALAQPSNSAMWDDRYYETHGSTFTWSDRGDDLLEESNYHAALAAIRGAAVHAGDDPDEDVIDASVNHWLVGSLRQLFVRVYNDDGSVSAAFKEAASLALYVREQYPIIDESDYSEREYDRFQASVREAVSDAQREYPEDTLDEQRAFESAVYDSEETSNLLGQESNGDVSWDDVAKIYASHRDAQFEQRAASMMVNGYGTPTPCDGQLALC